MPIAPGAVVSGDFRVLHRLGEGGMGSVWAVEQLSVGRKRALKVMRSDIGHDPRLRERFVQEAKIGATIESDHVVDVVAAGIDEELDLPWLAMELLEGRDLAAVLSERGPLPLQEVAEIVRQLGHALAAAHAVGVVHCDLKPENIFLARSRRSGTEPFDVKLLDLGLAKIAAEAQRTTSAHSMPMGTPLYMAPEQTDAGAAATPAIDVWALGLIAYRAITGRYFWRSAQAGMPPMTALMREVLVDAVPLASVRAAEDGVDSLLPAGGFDEWLARCLERDPARRPTVGDAVAVASALLGESPHRASTPTRRALRLTTPPDGIAATELVSPSPVPRTQASIRVTQDDPRFGVARVADIVVIDWRRTPTIPSIAEMERALLRSLAELKGEPAIVMPIVHTSNAAPEAAARSALETTIAKLDRSVSRVVYVVLGTGFQAATLRAIIAGLVLATRPSHTTKVYATVAEAVASLAPRADGTRPRAESLAAVIEAFAANRSAG